MADAETFLMQRLSLSFVGLELVLSAPAQVRRASVRYPAYVGRRLS
jgi:hypothetical protein